MGWSEIISEVAVLILTVLNHFNFCIVVLWMFYKNLILTYTRPKVFVIKSYLFWICIFRGTQTFSSNHNVQFSISHCAEFFFSQKKIREMKWGQNNKHDITKTLGLLEVWVKVWMLLIFSLIEFNQPDQQIPSSPEGKYPRHYDPTGQPTGEITKRLMP